MHSLENITVIIVTYLTQKNLLFNCLNSIDNKVKIKVVENSQNFELKNEINDQAIIAAIIPYLDNTQSSVLETIFIKMNGSNKNLQELKYEFELFCKSIHWQQ